jgi:hypothetical protein
VTPLQRQLELTNGLVVTQPSPGLLVIQPPKRETTLGRAEPAPQDVIDTSAWRVPVSDTRISRPAG